MHRQRSINHQIWDIAWPAILSNISIPLLGLVDTAILGHLGDTQYLGAVAIGSAILSFVYWGFSFLRMGTTGLVAKATGAGDTTGAALILAQSAVLALLIATLVFALHPLWLQLGFKAMAPADNLAELGKSYVSIRIYSAPAVLLTYACVGWFIGNRDTRWPMLIVVATNITNIALDFLLIIGLKLNSDGAALATVIAEYSGAVLALYGVWRKLSIKPDKLFWQSLRNWRSYAVLLQSGGHLIVRTVCLLFSFAFFTAMSEKMGGDTLAANTFMIQLLLLGAYTIDGFTYSAEALTGTRIGAGDMPGFYQVTTACALWCFGAAALVSIVFMLFGTLIFSVLTDFVSVRTLLDQYRWWLIALPLIAAPSYVLDGVFIGTAETRDMMVTMLFSTLCIYLPCWYFSQNLGNHGLWLSFTIFNASRGITLLLCFWMLSKNNRWLRKRAFSA